MFLNISDAAKHAGVCRRTIYNWIATGKLTVYKTPSGTVRINPTDLIKKEPQPMARQPVEIK